MAKTEAGHWVTLDDGRHIFIADSAGHVPRRLRAEGNTRFSKAHLERHLIEHHEQATGGTRAAHDEQRAGSPLRAAKATAHASNDPEVKFLAAVHDNLPEGRFSGTTINAKGLRVGDEFTIGGSRFRVAEDAQGMRVLEGGKDYPETPLDVLDKLPIDKGSLKQGKRRRQLEDAPFSSDVVIALSGSSQAVDPAGRPAEINGQRCHYVRKEIARAGHYFHRARRLSDGSFLEFDITPERMDRWALAFEKRKVAGIRPFVPHRHVGDDGEYIENENDARANFGYADEMYRDGDSLYATFQLIGDRALAAAAANDVSVYVTQDAIDAAGNEYDECIKHVCLTPDPIIPHLKPFERIAASADQPARDVPVFAWSADSQHGRSEMDSKTIANLRAKFGWGNDVPDDMIAEKAAEKALALSTEIQTLATERDTLKGERDAKAAEVLSLSSDSPTQDPLALSLITRAFKTDRERVIASGVVSEAGMKEIDNLLFSAGKPTRQALALSAGNADPFYSRLCEILTKFPGIKTNNAVPADAAPAEPRLVLSGDPGQPDPGQSVADARKQAEAWKNEQLKARGVA